MATSPSNFEIIEDYEVDVNVAVVGLPSHLLLQSEDDGGASTGSLSRSPDSPSNPTSPTSSSTWYDSSTSSQREANSGSHGVGVGKSCLCARFVLPSHDDYIDIRRELGSKITKEQFESPIVNGDHFLYFGSTVRSCCLRSRKNKEITQRQLRYRVVEQTTFIDASTETGTLAKTLAFPGCSRYLDSAACQTLTSHKVAGKKLSCVGPIAHDVVKTKGQSTAGESSAQKEKDAERSSTEMFRDNFNIDGFILVLDPTKRGHQMELQVGILRSLVELIRHRKRKRRPIALAITKSETLSTDEQEACKSYGKVIASGHRPLPVFFCSANDGLGVDAPFFHISTAVMREAKHGSKSTSDRQERIVPFDDLRKAWAVRLNDVVLQLPPVVQLLGLRSDWTTVPFNAVENTPHEWVLAVVIAMVGVEATRSILRATAIQMRRKLCKGSDLVPIGSKEEKQTLQR